MNQQLEQLKQNKKRARQTSAYEMAEASNAEKPEIKPLVAERDKLQIDIANKQNELQELQKKFAIAATKLEEKITPLVEAQYRK